MKLSTDVVNFSFIDKKSPHPVMKLLTAGMKSPAGNKKFLRHVLKLHTITIVKLMILLTSALKLPQIVDYSLRPGL
jgi:hypothetical protein